MPDHALILIAEDSDDDILLIQRSLEKAAVFNPTQIVRNGEEVIAYLEGRGSFASRDEYPLPALLLLDLKMPRTDGFEVLAWIRQQPAFKALRIIVLTSSEDIRDVNHAYEFGANSFLVKPIDFEKFVEIARFLKDYWLRTDKAPSLSRPPKLSSLRPDPRDRPMRILLRNLETGAFFRGQNDWTTNPMQAWDFQDSDRAVAVARHLPTKNLEIHLASDHGKPIFGTPLASELLTP